MALPKFYKVVTDQQGNIVPGVLCSVYNQGTAVLASLYQDDAGTVPLSNPLTNDATYGSVKFYINPGHFDLSFTKPGYTFEPIYDMQVPQDVLTLGTMATQNANAVAITGGSANGLTEVGIGVADAGYPLDVTGEARVTGFLGVGGVPGSDSRVWIKYLKASTNALTIHPTDNDTGGGMPVRFINQGGVQIGSITASGTNVSFNTSSDARLKHAITPLTDSLAVLDRLNPISHLWKADNSYGEGFLAHELQRELASAVTGEPDAVDAQGQIIPQQADYSKLVPRLTAVLKELRAQVQALTARVAQLEGAV